MFDKTEQILTGPLAGDSAGEDAFREINETIAALYRAAAELSITDPAGARFVISVARNMERESAPVSVARRRDI